MDELVLITCIVQRGKADKVVKESLTAGAEGATVFYGRGTGVREKLGLLGKIITPEKEIILIVAKRNCSDTVFDAIVKSGKLQEPGQGFIFTQKVAKAVGFLG